MGDEYTWLVGLDNDEPVKALVTKEDEEENLLVSTLKNEDISPDLYSEFLGLQDRVAESEKEEKDLYRYSEEIEGIEPYMDSDSRSSSLKNSIDEENVHLGPKPATHSLMNLSTSATAKPPATVTDNIIQIGDRFYTVTAVLFAALKIHLGHTIQGVEILSKDSYAAVSTHGQTAGRIIGRHLVSGAAVLRELTSVKMISAMIRETCHFTIDRTNLYTKWYTTSMISDDPEMVYRKSIRNTSSLSRPDCATTSLTLNSTIVKRRAQFPNISWMDRQLLWVTRDEGTGDVTRNIRRLSPATPVINDPSLLPNSHDDDAKQRQDLPSSTNKLKFSGTPSFHHCQSIYQSPSQAAFTANNAYNPSTKSSASDKGVVLRPTAAATANYYDLLDALISAAFDHKRSPGSAEAYAILVDMITPPDFEEKSSCAECYEAFSVTNFRHHCRNCGRSICRACSSRKNKRIPKYGYTDPVRVCYPCAIKVDAEATMDRVQWRLLRIKDFLNNQLIPFFSHGVDRGIDKASRVVDMGLFMLKSALMCNYPAMLIVETVDILKRYGMSGLAGVLMRNDFVEAVETLKKISGMDKHYPISLSELTACIYYRLAIERGIRGTDPDGEHRLHYPHGMEPDDEPYCVPVPLTDLESIIDYASMALMLVYEENPVECQRIATTQGYSCICAETISGAEKPAFGIYVSNNAQDKTAPVDPFLPPTPPHRSNSDEDCSSKGYDFKFHRCKPKEVVLTIRGTLSIHDVVTDIRAAPHPFPPSHEEILSLIYQGNDLDLESKQSLDHEGEESEGSISGEEEKDDNHKKEGAECRPRSRSRSKESDKDDWEWLLTASTKTYACTGIFRSACWLLSEVGKPLLELLNQGYRLIICGHSLGAAVASLVTYMLHEVGITNLHCYAYAPPSFVDAATADKMASFVTTVILHDDIIPRVTPQSIRILMKDVLFFQAEVFKYLEQDWKDAIERAAAIWAPRTRDADKIQTRQCQNQDMDHLQETKSSISLEKDGEVANEEDEVGEDNISQYLIVLEEEVIPLWCPGKLVHMYARNGVYDAAYVPRDFPNLRRIIVQGNIFRDHNGQSIFEALQEIRAARTSPCPPPAWTPYNDPKTQGVCKCCQSRFTWHSTFRGEAQEYKERYNCRSCGGLVCGPCSSNRHPVLRIGLITPSRICDTCYYNGVYSSDKNPD